MNIFAHTKKNEEWDSWQLLNVHLRETGDWAVNLFPFHPWDSSRSDEIHNFTFFNFTSWLTALGRLHDLGKADPDFQKYLIHSSQEVEFKPRCSINHSETGAAWAEENLGPFIGRTIAYIVAGHHAGLPDYNADGKASLRSRLVSGRKNLEKIRNKIQPYVEGISEDSLPMPFGLLTQQNYHLWVRMLFSCLVDADRLNTEAFADPEKAARRPKFPSLKELKEKFDTAMQTFIQSKTNGGSEMETVLAVAREEVRSACIEAGRTGETGIYSLTVPTGGGKTLSSMAFALEHAVARQKRRIIYVIPYTSVIEQTADIFRKIFGDNNIIEHHSNFNPEKTEKSRTNSGSGEAEPLSAEQIELAAENWDTPIVITTNVQFFESLYAAKTKQCRKLHNIMDSVVILDEAQMLRPEMLNPCVDVMNLLAEHFGTTLVICTATQPTLDRLSKIKTGYSDLRIKNRIIPEELEKRLYRLLSRVTYTFDTSKRYDWEELASELSEQDEVLCVVNSRKDCYDLYQTLCSRTGEGTTDDTGEDGLPEIVHLSALMCGEHRSQLIEKIKRRLLANRQAVEEGKPKKPIRVISTQLVEAGVDLDFPVVYRALAGLDSVIQAAGRCNREGKLGPSGGIVRVFYPPKDPPGGLLRKGADKLREMLQADSDLNPNEPKAVSRFFHLFYSWLNNLDQEEIIKKLTQNVSSFEVPFRTVGEKFRLIEDDYSAPVIVSYQKGEELIHRLEIEGPHRDLMRQIQRYTVNIPISGENGIMTMVSDGKVREVYSGIYVQQMPGFYNNFVGFDIFRKTIPNETAII